MWVGPAALKLGLCDALATSEEVRFAHASFNSNSAINLILNQLFVFLFTLLFTILIILPLLLLIFTLILFTSPSSYYLRFLNALFFLLFVFSTLSFSSSISVLIFPSSLHAFSLSHFKNTYTPSYVFVASLSRLIIVPRQSSSHPISSPPLHLR